MRNLPPPTSFAEGQRALYGWLMSAAGVFAGTVCLALITILVWGGWPSSLYDRIIVILGIALGGFLCAMVAVIIALAVGGPVGRISVKASKEGAELSAEDKT